MFKIGLGETFVNIDDLVARYGYFAIASFNNK
jgi:hypothetical protein